MLNNEQRVCQYLQNRPIALFDSEYGCAPLIEATAAIAADKLMRIRSNRCLWSAPPAYSGRGRPKIHGQQFRPGDSQSWWEAEQTLESVEQKLGKIRLRKWDDLHFRGSPKHPMTLILVERLETVTGRLNSQPLWLVWVGIQMPSLNEIWQLYLRHFALEHWYRLAKQTLHWTVPKLTTPEQCEGWSDLMPLLTWQLWLAKDLVREIHLPTALVSASIDPGQGCTINASTFNQDWDSAVAPKRRVHSDGGQTGQPRTPRCRYPVVKKGKGRFQKLPKFIS